MPSFLCSNFVVAYLHQRSEHDRTMAELRPVAPVLFVVAAFSRHPEALEWGRQRLEHDYGPVVRVSEPFVFDQTNYYTATMGPELRKQFFVFGDLIEADRLAAIKRHTNILEEELVSLGTYPEVRPLNLDPGLLNLGKFMLATTKDQAHRIYLGQGIYAEVTLRFHAGAWEPWPWTYADYREPAVRELLRQVREDYRALLQRRHSGRP
jgi:hypothetical protein